MEKTYVQSQLSKENVKSYPSYYKNLLISPIGGGSTQTISTSQSSLLFEIPPGVYNFSRCSLEFSMAIAGNAAANSLYILPTDYCTFFQSIQMYTSNSNVYLIDLQNVDIYSKSLASVLDYKNRSENDGFVYQSSRDVKCGPAALKNYSANPAANNPADLTQVQQSGMQIWLGADAAGGFSCTTDFILNASQNVGGASIICYPSQPGKLNELSHFHYQKVAAAQPFAATQFNIKLKDILHDSFFVIDRDFYISSSMFLKIIFNTKNFVVMNITGNTGNANIGVNVVAENTNDITLTNIKLMSYVQANPQLEMLIRESAKGTQEIIMPRVVTNSMSFTATTTQNTTFRVNSIFQSRLYKNYYNIVDTATAVKNLTSNIVTTVDANAKNELSWTVGRLFTNYQIYINNQLFMFHNPTLYEDFDYYKQYFKKSSLTNLKAFYAQGGIYTVFDTEPVDGENEYKVVNYKGLEMPNNEQIFQYNITTVANSANVNIHYLHSVLLSKLYYKDGLFFTMPPI